MGVLGNAGTRNMRVGLAASLLSAAIISTSGLGAGPIAFAAGASAPFPTPDIQITKTLTHGPAVTAPGSSTWTATYELQVDNIGGGHGTYDLTDDPGFAPGLIINDQQATSSDIAISGDFNAGVGNTSIATDVAIAPDERDLVEVIVTFTVTDSVDPADMGCGQDPVPGNATFNMATATPNIGPVSTDHDCGPLPGPDLTVDKTVSSAPTDNGDGTFTIVYAIDVANKVTAGPTAYDLADQTSFSPGVAIESQSVVNTTPGTVTTDPTFPTSGTIVASEPIAAGSTHSYQVTVVASLAVNTTTTYVACSSTTGSAGEGLFNRASLTVDGTTTAAELCADIEGDLTIVTTDGGTELQVGDGPFDYILTVINVGGASTGDRVSVTDVLPDEFAWVRFPDTAGGFPFCAQSGQFLTCELDPSLVDAGGESTSFVLTAEAREGTAPDEVGYRNLSYVDSPTDPALPSPSCTAIGTAISSSSSFFSVSDNNTACDETPIRPVIALDAEPPPTTPAPAPPTTITAQPPPTVPLLGLPATGSSDSTNILRVATLLLALGGGLTLIVRRRPQLA